jgi:hypothetical protein
MAGQLIPPPELAPTLPSGTTWEERLALWCELMNTGEQFLLAGLRQRVGPTGNVQAAYRDWQRQQMEQKDRDLVRMAERFQLCVREDGS